MKIGFIFRPWSFWIGVHWSKYNKRLCLNLLPMCTIYLVLKGGVIPEIKKM